MPSAHQAFSEKKFMVMAASAVEDLDLLLAATDADEYPWAVCCFGHNENAVMLAAMARGGHVRLGLESNLNLLDGSLAKDNATLIRRYVADICASKRQPANASEVRACFL